MFDALLAGAIPIYLGAASIDAFVPPGSVLRVQDFPDVTALAERLRAPSPRNPLQKSAVEAGGKVCGRQN